VIEGRVDQLEAAVATGKLCTVVALSGESDANSDRKLHDILISEIAKGAQNLVVDLSGLGFIDSGGIQVLAVVRAMVRERGGTLILVSPQPVVGRALSLFGVDEFIPVYRSVEEAEDALAMPPQRRGG
jgi:anti-sigma B factor antagonist